MEYCGYGDDEGFPVGEPDSSTNNNNENRSFEFETSMKKMIVNFNGMVDNLRFRYWAYRYGTGNLLY